MDKKQTRKTPLSKLKCPNPICSYHGKSARSISMHLHHSRECCNFLIKHSQAWIDPKMIRDIVQANNPAKFRQKDSTCPKAAAPQVGNLKTTGLESEEEVGPEFAWQNDNFYSSEDDENISNV